jgi:hypothetical protein
MKKRSILDSSKSGSGCKVCRTVRPFLIVAGALLALLWSQPQWRFPEGFDYSTLVGDVFLAAFVLYIVWRVYDYRKGGHEHDHSVYEEVPVRRVRKRNRVVGDPRGWK